MPHFDESTTQPFVTGAQDAPAELYKSTQPLAAIAVGNAMRIFVRGTGIAGQAGKITPELNRVDLLADGIPIGDEGDVVADLLLWRIGDTQGRIGGTLMAADGTISRVPDTDVLGLAWNRQQQFRLVGESDTASGIRLESFGIQR